MPAQWRIVRVPRLVPNDPTPRAHPANGSPDTSNASIPTRGSTTLSSRITMTTTWARSSKSAGCFQFERFWIEVKYPLLFLVHSLTSIVSFARISAEPSNDFSPAKPIRSLQGTMPNRIPISRYGMWPQTGKYGREPVQLRRRFSLQGGEHCQRMNNPQKTSAVSLCEFDTGDLTTSQVGICQVFRSMIFRRGMISKRRSRGQSAP